MEARARRRLALLSSHVNPPSEYSPRTCLVASACASDTNVETKNGQENDCVFCQIIRSEAPALKVSLNPKLITDDFMDIGAPESSLGRAIEKLYEDDECLCILDTYPLCYGHCLIIPKSHFPSLDATPPSIIGAMCSKVPIISKAIMKATGCDSFNLLVNNGEAAGQVIYHTHIHIIPRKEHDCLWASESIRRRPLKLDQEASQLANHIRQSLICLNSYEDSRSTRASSSLTAN